MRTIEECKDIITRALKDKKIVWFSMGEGGISIEYEHEHFKDFIPSQNGYTLLQNYKKAADFVLSFYNSDEKSCDAGCMFIQVVDISTDHFTVIAVDGISSIHKVTSDIARIIMKNGTQVYTTDSINTITARITIAKRQVQL